MPDVLIRNVDPKTLKEARRLAAWRGRSLQQELREVLERAVALWEGSWAKEAGRLRRALLRKRNGRVFSDSAMLVRADRDRR